jgi:hypothetical protein
LQAFETAEHKENVPSLPDIPQLKPIPTIEPAAGSYQEQINKQLNEIMEMHGMQNKSLYNITNKNDYFGNGDDVKNNLKTGYNEKS